jgi:hypothetical protein
VAETRRSWRDLVALRRGRVRVVIAMAAGLFALDLHDAVRTR